MLNGCIYSNVLCIFKKKNCPRKRTPDVVSVSGLKFHFKTLRRERAPLSLGVGSEHFDPFLLLCNCGAGSQNESLITPLPQPHPLLMSELSSNTPKPNIHPKPHQFHLRFPNLTTAADRGKIAKPDFILQTPVIRMLLPCSVCS